MKGDVVEIIDVVWGLFICGMCFILKTTGQMCDACVCVCTSVRTCVCVCVCVGCNMLVITSECR